MKAYLTKAQPLPGSNVKEISSLARKIYNNIKVRSKRRPYVRSNYFRKDKVFIDYFWGHLWQKNWRDRTRRLRYYHCAIDLIRKSNVDPVSKENPNNKYEILHRFAGITFQRELFYVQISENKKSGQKKFISVFPG